MLTKFSLTLKYLFALVTCLQITAFTQAQTTATQTETATQLLTRVDQYRNFKDTAFSFDLELISEQPDKAPKEFSMEAKILDSHTSLIAYTKPAREQGKALLMNERNLWFFSKMAKKPIRITPQQRLLGEASNGDVASTDFSGDYEPRLIDSPAATDPGLQLLQLDAKPDAMAAYQKIILWVERTSAKPQRAEFYAESGKHLKTAYYTRYAHLAELDNKEQLVELEIHNALREGNITRMKYSNFKLEELDKNLFKPEQIKRLMSH